MGRTATPQVGINPTLANRTAIRRWVDSHPDVERTPPEFSGIYPLFHRTAHLLALDDSSVMRQRLGLRVTLSSRAILRLHVHAILPRSQISGVSVSVEADALRTGIESRERGSAQP